MRTTVLRCAHCSGMFSAAERTKLACAARASAAAATTVATRQVECMPIIRIMACIKGCCSHAGVQQGSMTRQPMRGCTMQQCQQNMMKTMNVHALYPYATWQAHLGSASQCHHDLVMPKMMAEAGANFPQPCIAKAPRLQQCSRLLQTGTESASQVACIRTAACLSINLACIPPVYMTTRTIHHSKHPHCPPTCSCSSPQPP